MKLTLVLCLLSILSTAFRTPEDIDVFRNGRYLIDFTADNLADYEIEIKEDEFVIGSTDAMIKGKIIKYDSDLYIFRNNEKPSTEATSEIGRLIDKSFGEQCVAVKRVRGNRIYFRTTYVGNLHVTVNEGVFIKKKDK